MAGKKVPALRVGLTVDDLLRGTWLANPNRYTADGELVELSDKVLRDALQGLIDHANSGERVTKRTVIATLCAAADHLKAMKDIICEGLTRGEFTPTVLDELAGI